MALVHKYVDSVVVEVPKSLILEQKHGKQEGYVMAIMVKSVSFSFDCFQHMCIGLCISKLVHLCR